MVQWLEEGTREGEVTGLNPAGLVAANFTRKMSEMDQKNAEDGRALAGGGPLPIKKFPFFGFFRFQLCRVSGTRQRLCRVLHLTKATRQKMGWQRRLCRVSFVGHSAKALPSARHSVKLEPKNRNF